MLSDAASRQNPEMPRFLTDDMEKAISYTITSRKVAHEIIDGEVIVIHFDSGNYYSFEGVSSQLWQWIAAGASRQQIWNAFRVLEPDQSESLDAFIDSLVKEELLEENLSGAGQEPAAPLPIGEIAFESPKFAKYNDMQNLLLSDPIHDVDETGWPNLESGNS
jgi:hypothetical protein